MVFSIPSFLGVGDDYDKKDLKDKRAVGRNFAVPGPKSGNGPDAMLGKQFVSIHAGDRYVDPDTMERREKVEKRKKNIVPQGFRPTNAAPKPCGPGDSYTTMGQKFPHMTDFVVPRRGDIPAKVEVPKRGIYAHFPKTGGFGYAGLTLSRVGEDYVASEYDAPRKKAMEERERHIAALAKRNAPPFRCPGRLGTTLDEGPMTGASQCYTLTKPMPPKQIFVSQAAVSVAGRTAAWRPAGALPQLRYSEIKYLEDPYDGYDPRVGTVKKKPSDKFMKPAGATNTSWYTKSIAFARF